MTAGNGTTASSWVRETCPHCSAEVPAGTFCGSCGAHLRDTGGRGRLHHYAAAPHEHVTKMAVISTLFPHLPQRHAHVFREALLGGLMVVALLTALRLFAPALLLATVLLPVLYLLYLYEVEVYEHEPTLVVVVTFAAGAALGAAYTVVTGHLFAPSPGATPPAPVVSVVVLPIVLQLLMLAGPLLLLGRSGFDETLDGLTFGAASALGFTAAAVIATYWHVLTAPLVTSVAATTEQVAGILRAAVLAALVSAATTGMITTALWARHHGRSRRRHASSTRHLASTVLIAFGAQVALAVASYYVTSLLVDVVAWGVAAAALLVWLRVLIHFALLDEAAEAPIGEIAACPECHRLVPTMLFCPACGMHRSAAPKRAGAHLAEVALGVS